MNRHGHRPAPEVYLIESIGLDILGGVLFWHQWQWSGLWIYFVVQVLLLSLMGWWWFDRED